MPPPPPTPSTEEDNPEESLLRDVLLELDRERAKRAEMEVQIRQLLEEREQSQQVKPAAVTSSKETTAASDTTAPSRQALMAMESQVLGYQQLVHALTQGKPAISAAAKYEAWLEQQPASVLKNQQHPSAPPLNLPKGLVPTLPLHVVRLLETLPWDPRAKTFMMGCERVYEWQVYQAQEGQCWRHSLKHFPQLFRQLPTVQPLPSPANLRHKKEVFGPIGGDDAQQQTQQQEQQQQEQDEEYQQQVQDRSLLVFLAGDKKSPPTQHGVLTNASLTVMYNLEYGYPLPQDGGTWEWLGNWRVDHGSDHAAKMGLLLPDGPHDMPNFKTGKRSPSLPRDEQGWTYAKDAQSFLLLSSSATRAVYADPGAMAEGGKSPLSTEPLRKIRRRTWVRHRVLKSFPFCSERTLQYLQLVADKASWTEAARKLSLQVVETKTALTAAEELVMQLQKELHRTQAILHDYHLDPAALAASSASSSPSNATTTFVTSNLDRTASKDEDLNTSLLLGAKLPFDWKRIGRGALIEKMKAPPSLSTANASSSITSQDHHPASLRQRSHSSDEGTRKTTDQDWDTNGTVARAKES